MQLTENDVSTSRTEMINFGQQLRDAFRGVQQAVVIVRTEQKISAISAARSGEFERIGLRSPHFQ